MISAVAMPEIIFLLLAIVAAFILYKILKTVSHMMINTVLGLLILIAANLIFGLNIAYTWVVIAICALTGVVGACFIIVLNYLGIAFLG